jgi:hypothetical protein
MPFVCTMRVVRFLGRLTKPEVELRCRAESLLAAQDIAGGLVGRPTMIQHASPPFAGSCRAA